ncbi:MAG: hypothetical protein AAGC57_14590, partial [Pseudomonadota bacterium]
IAQPPHPVVEVKEPRLLRHANLPRCSSTAIESANHSGGEVSRGPQLVPSARKARMAVVKVERAYEQSGKAKGLVELDISFNAADHRNKDIGAARLQNGWTRAPGPCGSPR